MNMDKYLGSNLYCLKDMFGSMRFALKQIKGKIKEKDLTPAIHNGKKKGILKDYVLRIYRREKNDPRVLVGVVEEVGVEGNKAFSNLDELWSILNPSKVKAVKTNKPNKPKKLNGPNEPVGPNKLNKPNELNKHNKPQH
jgi:hypothetical protein